MSPKLDLFGGGDVVKLTRKKRAVASGKAMVCSTAPSPGTVAIFLNVWPSSLFSRSGPLGLSPNGLRKPPKTSVTARMAWGFLNSN